MLLSKGRRGFAAFLTSWKMNCSGSIQSPPASEAFGALLLLGKCAVYAQRQVSWCLLFLRLKNTGEGKQSF